MSLAFRTRSELSRTLPARTGSHLPRSAAGVCPIIQAGEGLPNALLEAAGAGVPLVATAVGGMREVLPTASPGLLVPHGDPRAMSEAVTRVLSGRSSGRPPVRRRENRWRRA